MREKTYRIALGGVLSALAAVFMMMGGIFPFAQFCGPAMACICVMISIVFQKKTAKIWFIFSAVTMALMALI